MSSSKTDLTPKNWKMTSSGGPVLTTAIHTGNHIRNELQPYLYANNMQLRREEDPLTDIFASVGDDVFCCYTSRFEVDLNRKRELAFATRAEQTWGLKVWRDVPPEAVIERSLEQHDIFYQMMESTLQRMIHQHGKVLVVDIHSYNHRRDGIDAPAPQSGNPDIDLGLTTLDQGQFGALAAAFTEILASQPCQGRKLDVRGNVRYPDGGYWPEWVFANFGDDICTITLEYKKFYMDEWTDTAFLPVVEDLRKGLFEAINIARKELLQCGSLRKLR